MKAEDIPLMERAALNQLSREWFNLATFLYGMLEKAYREAPKEQKAPSMPVLPAFDLAHLQGNAWEQLKFLRKYRICFQKLPQAGRAGTFRFLADAPLATAYRTISVRQTSTLPLIPESGLACSIFFAT